MGPNATCSCVKLIDRTVVDFLVFPLVVEWFTLVIVVLYLLVRESRRGTSASLMFGAQFILGLGKY